MINYENIISFLFQPDKDWGLSAFPFFAAFVIFYLIYIGLTKATRYVRLTYVILFGLFFAWKANGLLILLLPATALFSWWATRMMMRIKRHRKLMLAAIIIIDLLPLAYFKYTNFLISIVSDLFSSNLSPVHLIIPVGLSFYTFQAISYSVDVYKWRFTSETPFIDYLFYLTFFPLIMAGPITRAEVIIPQVRRITAKPKEESEEVKESKGHALSANGILVNRGLWLIMIGLIKKAVIADYIAQYNNWVFADPTAFTGFENIVAILGFTLQIFFDFSGYSDIAIGLAALMGIEIGDNFRFPYQSLNPTEFWHRWHISLSTWFRDYVYIPMGGNRHGIFHTCLNCFLTMFIAGLWHGASWMFVAWGTIHGIALVIHKVCKRLFLDRIPNIAPVKIVSWLMMFTFICLSWIVFRADSFDTIAAMFAKIGSDTSASNIMPFIVSRPLLILFIALGLELQSIRENDYLWLQQKFIAMPWVVKLLLFLITLQLVINFGQKSIQPFIYTKF